HCKTQKTLICNKMNGEKEKRSRQDAVSLILLIVTPFAAETTLVMLVIHVVHLKCIQPPQAIHQDHLADTSSLPPPT
ncbi:hypothetical protein HID58_083168, partial [Brassica napus]